MKYFTCAETAKLIRETLKAAYPNVKFGVRSKVYSGGASISIYYDDGPATENVKALVAPFEGSYFDGMQDYKGLNYVALDGEEVRFGADFVFVNRSYTDAAVQAAIDAVYEKNAYYFVGSLDPKATVEQFRKGMFYKQYDLQQFIYKELEALGKDIKPADVTMLGRIKSLGDDGYGYGCVGRIAA